MLTLSEGAVKRVKEFIAEQSEGYSGIRVSVEAAGCSGFQYAMNLEQDSRQGDQVIQVDGFQVFVDEGSMAHLQGTEIDYVESTEGAGFKFKNPNVTGTCGCGESFQVE
jgi:iron-sulfur cluster assembly protein